jgi:hypothetical protein
VDAGQVEVLGSRLWEVSLRRLQPTPVADLQARAEQLAGRVIALPERLRPVEVDHDHRVAQLRSDRPGHWGDGQFYYEILLQADGNTSMRRYQAPGSDQSRRHQVHFTLTHEKLAKLVTDLIRP